jgi:iron complex outermembrane receptor protein
MVFHRPRSRTIAISGFGLACGLICHTSALVAEGVQGVASISDLKKLSVEQLSSLEVSSVSRTEEPLGGAAAAVAVLTSEDIRRSGSTSVPEALRMVPGVQVGRQTSNGWAVSARGFTSINSEKLLVLSDTRSIYTPLYSGVFWNAQDYLLQDIDRIEVVRGPGATLWGSNAVNGVINITTKTAKDTQGLYAETGAGSEERFTGAARYGGKIADRGYYRVFGQFVDRDSTFHPNLRNSDDWHIGHVGARADWEGNDGHSFTLQGDAYDGTIGLVAPSISVSGRPAPPDPLAVSVAGGNILGRWRHHPSTNSDFQVRAYYDRTHRNDSSFVDDLDTFDIDVQHRMTWAPRQEVTWGGSYRFTANRNEGKGVFALNPASSRDQLVSGFVQDQVRVQSNLRVTVGTKLEHNDFSGGEIQPSGRVAWDVAAHHFVWGAVSRAVRVPTRLERDIAVDTGNPAASTVARVLGNPEFGSERLLAYEVGYRWQALRSLFIDVAGFRHQYRGLASLEFGNPFTDLQSSRTIIPVINQNLTDGHAEGVEALVTFAPVRSWRLTTTSTTFDLHLEPGGRDLNRGRFYDGATPRHQLGLRSFLDLPSNLQFDAMFRQVTELQRLPTITTGDGIPGYAELDLRVAWHGWQHAEISVAGQNLLHDHHVEFGAPTSRGEIERGAYAKISWGF